MKIQDSNGEPSNTPASPFFGTVIVEKLLSSIPLGDSDFHKQPDPSRENCQRSARGKVGDYRKCRIPFKVSEYCEGSYGHWLDSRRFEKKTTYRSEVEGHGGHLSPSAAWVQRWVHGSNTPNILPLDGPGDLP